MAPVSVVMPTYNCGRWLVRAVDSVLAQTARPAEILVVDDGSTDDTAARLEPYRGHVRYFRQPNRGVAAARNAGVAAANEPWVAFLDADDVWHPRKLELQTRVLGQRRDLAILGACWFAWPVESFPDVGGDPAGRVADVSWRRLVVKNVLATSAVVVSRIALDRAGPFDTSLQGPEDWDLWLRVTEAAPAANLDLPLVGYRSVVGSVSRQADTCRGGMLRVLEKVSRRGAPGWGPLVRRKAHAVLNHECSHVYGAAGRYGAAIRAELASLLWYPLPLARAETGSRLGRPRRLAVQVLRALRLKGGDVSHPACLSAGRLDAVERQGRTEPPVALPTGAGS
jgi:glycosyltransferase involved in cell wall biosynthesis